MRVTPQHAVHLSDIVQLPEVGLPCFFEKFGGLEKKGYFCGEELGYAVIAQLVEHQLPKLRVAGSSPVYRSKSQDFGSGSFCFGVLKVLKVVRVMQVVCIDRRLLN